MHLKIDKQAEQPIYEQIRSQIEQLVRDGVLQPGAKIPSVRQLALKLGVGKNTVSQAYDELAAESLIETRKGSGTYITEQLDVATRQSLRAANSDDDDSGDQARMRWEPYNFRSEFFGLPVSDRSHEMIRFTQASPDPELFPFERIKQVASNMLWYPKEFFFDRGHAQGYQPLVEHLEKEMALSSVPMEEGDNEIIVTAGFRRALDLVLGYVLQPGQKVAIESPSYPGLLNVLIAKRVEYIPIPMDEQGMDTEYLEGVVRRGEISAVITIPTYHNPTGISMSLERRKHLLEIAQRANLPVIEDDWGRHLRYEGTASPPLKAMDPGGYVIHIGTFSKVFLPGMRIGWITCPSEIAVPLLRAKMGLDSGDSFFLQSLLHEIIVKGHFAKHVRKSLKQYKLRRQAMVDSLHECLPKGCSFHEPLGGFCIWLNLPDNVMSLPLLQRAREEGVDFVPANLVMPDRKDSNGLRLSFSRNSPENIRDGIRILCSVIEDYMHVVDQAGPERAEYEDLFK